MYQLTYFTMHSALSSATASKMDNSVTVSVYWNANKKEGIAAKERHLNIPAESIKVSPDDASPAFRPLLESILMSAAVAIVKDHVNEEGNLCFQILEDSLTQSALIDYHMQAGNVWVDSEALKVAFKASETFKKLVSRPEYQSNASFRKAVDSFFADILKCAGKKSSLDPDQALVALSKLDDDFLSTDEGLFVARRLKDFSTRKNNKVSYADIF